jgi:nucleotide-binding universal stress UspA family protein
MGAGPLVVGVDGSEGSSTALRWAVETAGSLGSPVSAVFGYSPWAGMLFAVPPFDADNARELFRAQFREEWCAPLVGAGVRYEQRFVSDDPATALLEVAEKEHAALIALGAHGHSRWSPHVLGSVTAKVLHHSKWPVAVVPHPPSELPPSGRMIVGVDGSPGSRGALQWAAGQAAALGRQVRAVCVTPLQLWHEQPTFMTQGGEVVVDEASGLRALSDAVAAASDVPIETVVLEGDPADTLLGLTAEWDLLVLGSRGHSSLGDVVFGSVGRVCATRATRPVVIVPGAGS